jgi:hypothetical protein
LCKCPEIDETIEKFGPKILMKGKVNPFWKDVFEAYSEYYERLEVNTKDEILAEPLFFNNKFKINNMPFHFKDWSENGVFYVKQLLQEDGTFLDVQSFNSKYTLDVQFLDYYGCVSCIKSYFNKYKVVVGKNECISRIKAIKCITQDLRGSKLFYDVLIGKACLPNACTNWQKIITQTPLEWPKIFNAVTKIQEVKLKWFQIKINNRNLVTNSVLKEMGIVANNRCNFCKTEKDSIYHYLWQCEYVKTFWAEFENFLKNKCDHCIRLKLSDILVLFGIDNNVRTDQGFDFILLRAKFFVYKCRINNVKPNFNIFLKELEYLYKIDEYIYRISMQQSKFILKWLQYRPLFSAT